MANTTVKKNTRPKNVKRKISKVERLQKQADKSLVEGVAIHTTTNSRTASSFLTDVSDYSDPNLERRAEVVGLARKLRSVEGVCSSVIDLLVDFAIVKGSFYTDNEELKGLLNKWADYVNSPIQENIKKGVVFPVPGLRAFARKVADDYFTDGDSVFSLFWKNSVKLDPNGDAYFLPVAIKALDTLTLEADEDLAKLGYERLELKLSTRVIDKIKNPQTDADKALKDVLPKEWISSLNKNEPIILDPRVTYHLKRNAKDYKPWGESYLLKAFSAISNKRRLQAVDASTIDGLINRITIFKVGLQDKEKNPAYHMPSARRVNYLIELLSDPTRMNAIVWPGPDLEVIDVGPDAKILEFNEKYKQADIDILRALHVSPLLIDGSGTTKDWIEFLSTEVGLNAVRNEFEQVLTLIAKEIAIANNMEYETLGYRYETLPLKEEAMVKNFAVKLYELGALSIETFLKAMGYDINLEKVLKQKEEDEGLDELFTNPDVPGFTNLDEQPGRPDNVEEVTPREAASISDAETMYLERYSEIFNRMADSVKVAMQNKNQQLAEMLILSHFNEFNTTVDMELAQVFRKYAKRNTAPELSKIKAWNDAFIQKFYREALEAFLINPNEFKAFVDKQNYRLYQYARESKIKAFWTAQIVKARFAGYTKAKVVCPEGSTCELSYTPDEQYTFDYLVENFPTHPHCNCKLEFIR